jgi:hypothetical protein
MKPNISDYSVGEIKRFQWMHEVLSAYNQALGTKEELPLPDFTDEEMSAYSVYREIWISYNAEL